jgi:hypothetical protein
LTVEYDAKKFDLGGGVPRLGLLCQICCVRKFVSCLDLKFPFPFFFVSGNPGFLSFCAIIEKLTRRTNFIKSVFTAEGGEAQQRRGETTDIHT